MHDERCSRNIPGVVLGLTMKKIPHWMTTTYCREKTQDSRLEVNKHNRSVIFLQPVRDHKNKKGSRDVGDFLKICGISIPWNHQLMGSWWVFLVVRRRNDSVNWSQRKCSDMNKQTMLWLCGGLWGGWGVWSLISGSRWLVQMLLFARIFRSAETQGIWKRFWISAPSHCFERCRWSSHTILKALS